MNKLLTISLILLFSLLMLQCEEDTRPKVAFTLSSSNVAVGEQVQFNNNTEGADSYHWYFGDGEESTQENPTHSYNTAGIYLVSLIAKKGNANGAGYATIFVGQISSTLGNLKLTYREEGTENLIPGCQVTLFLNQSDLENNINAVAEGFTDENGEILFENLEPGNYYVKAFKHEGSTTWDNAGLNNVVTVVAGEQANYVGYAAVIFQKRFVIYNQIFTDIQVTIGGETKIAPPQEAVDFFLPGNY
jgi:PKD repeat protein